MNKRQAKKHNKKELHGISWCWKSYKELKKIEKAHKEYRIEVERKKKNCLDYQWHNSLINCIDYPI